MIRLKPTVAGVKPTLADHDVLQFCKTGFLVLEGVIPDSTNEWVYAYMDRENAAAGSPMSGIANEERFVEEVLLHPEVAGAARSLLGDNFALPDQMATHRLVEPKKMGQWHMDGGSQFERACNLLQVFYVPQTNTKEMGPTYFLPGSHLVPITVEELRHFGHLAGQVQTIAPAGSVFFTHYSIWHRQGGKTDASVRNMLKWMFWRTAPPRRDWIIDPEFDFGLADYSYANEYFDGSWRNEQSVPRVAEMFSWLCGKSDHFRWLGGAGWPYIVTPRAILEKEDWMTELRPQQRQDRE